MNIGIDITPIAKDKAGIGFFTYSIIKSLGKIDLKNQYYLLSNKSIDLGALNLPKNYKTVVIEDSKAGTGWMFKGRRLLKEKKVDFFISTSNFLWSIIFNNTIQVVHDLAPLKFPQFFTKKGSLSYSLQLRLALNRARYVLTISNTVLSELSLVNNKTNRAVVSLGLHDWVFKAQNAINYSSLKEKYSLPKEFFIIISTLEPRKNHISLIKAFAEFVKLHPEVKLVIVGKKGWFYEKIFETVKKLSLESSVIFTGYVPDEDLPGLIDLSIGGVMLSFYEGFGLPVIEILARNKKILLSDIPVFKEVAKGLNNVTFTKIDSYTDIVEGLKTTYSSNTMTQKDVTAKYSWDIGANKVLEIINQLNRH